MPDRLLVLAWRSFERGDRDRAQFGSPRSAVAAQLRYLRRFATVVPLGPALETLGAGRALPRRAVALTFDDGYKAHLDTAAALLRELGLPATFFLAPALLAGDAKFRAQPLHDRARLLDWNGARQLVSEGFSVGLRLLGHHRPGGGSGGDQLQELVAAHCQLQQALDVPVHLLAYPDGVGATHDLQLLHAIRRAGYSHAFTTRASTVRPSTPAYGVPRIAMPRRWVPTVPRTRTLPSARPGAAATRPRPDVPDRRRHAPIRLEVVPLEEIADDLSRLALRTRNIFATGEWLSLWWRHFGAGHRPLVTACRSADGRVVGVLPLYLWSSWPLRVLRFIGHGAGDQLGPVYATEDAAEVAEAMRRALESQRWDVFIGDQLVAPALWSSFLGAKVLLREGNLVLRAPESGWDGYLAGQSPNFRQQLGRRQRRLAREHTVVFRLVRDANELPGALDTLFRLHALRWPEGSAFLAKEAFHREVATVGFDRGWTRLWLLELDGEAVAAWYGLRFGGVELYYQAGRDPAWNHRSVGFVLLAHSIRSAFEDGMEEYRFLRGDESYKYRFAEEDVGLETIALTRGPTAKVALSTVRHAYPLVKSRIGRLRWRLV